MCWAVEMVAGIMQDRIRTSPRDEFGIIFYSTVREGCVWWGCVLGGGGFPFFQDCGGTGTLSREREGSGQLCYETSLESSSTARQVWGGGDRRSCCVCLGGGPSRLERVRTRGHQGLLAGRWWCSEPHHDTRCDIIFYSMVSEVGE